MAIYGSSKKQPFGDSAGHLANLAFGSANYWFSFVSDPLTVLFFLFWEAIVLRSSCLILSLSFGAGFLSWSLLEYVLHCWVYHRGRTPAHVGHKQHHETPEALISMPWFIVTALMASAWYVLAYRLQFHFILSFMAGLLTGYREQTHQSLNACIQFAKNPRSPKKQLSIFVSPKPQIQ